MKYRKLLNVKLNPKRIYPDKVLVTQNDNGFWLYLKDQEITVNDSEVTFNNINHIIIQNINNMEMKYMKPQELETILNNNYQEYIDKREEKLNIKMSHEYVDSLKKIIDLYDPGEDEIQEYEQIKKDINLFDTNTHFFKEVNNELLPVLNDDINAIIKAVKFNIYRDNCECLLLGIPIKQVNEIIINYDIENERLFKKGENNGKIISIRNEHRP